MGRYQAQRGNPETKLFYLVDQLIGGINTDFSDDTSPDNEFRSIVNFNLDKRGSLYKRMGFGKLDALSQIFNLFERLPEVKSKDPDNPKPEEANDNIVYMKLLVNDNRVFRNLASFKGEKAYREYQKAYGFQNNSWSLLMITTNKSTNLSTSWIFNCKLPPLKYDEEGNELPEDTIEVSSDVKDLPVLFNWNNNLCNIDTIEFFDKIYLTSNNKGIVCFDRNSKEFTYSGYDIKETENKAYKPNAMEIRKIGFNILGDDPLYWIDYQGLTTNSIQGVYLTTNDGKPLTVLPNGGVFRLNILYTGENSEFEVSFKEGEKTLTATVEVDPEINKTGLKVYKVTMQTVPSSEVEIKIQLKDVTIDPYYDYYQVGPVDPEEKEVKSLNIGDYGICEMYNRAVYYKDDTIWFSQINNFSYVPNYNYVSLPIEPTDKITRIVFFRNVYIVFTKNRIYKIIGSFGSSDFEVMPVNLSVGCHAPNTIVQIENELYFASTRGLYALKSSDFVDGIENLKELDTKVKQLTADRTTFVDSLQESVVRYNGISDNAYAIRYKDKYMLFLNNYLIGDDYKQVSNIDVLVYQYELKAFSEIRFPIKPTFLFMVDNHILTYGTVPEKEEFTNEDVVLSYDFENTSIVDGKIKDSSDNKFDATVFGNLVSSPGIGLETSKNSSYVKLPDIDTDLTKGFNIELNGKFENIDNMTLFELKQSDPDGTSSPNNFSIFTNWDKGYRGELICSTVPNEITRQTTVNYIFRYHRQDTGVAAKRNGTFELKERNTSLIGLTDFEFDFGDALYQDVKEGSFVVSHDSNGEYNKNWSLKVNSEYAVYETGWIIGENTSLDIVRNGVGSSKAEFFGIRFICRTEVFNGGCRVFVKPAFRVNQGGSISIGERDMYISIDGNMKSCKIPPAKGSGPLDFFGNEVDHTFYYNGQKTITIDGTFNMRANIGGTYIENIEVDAFQFGLPRSESYNNAIWYSLFLNGYQNVILNKIYKASYRTLKVLFYSKSNVMLSFNSEFSDEIVNITNDSMVDEVYKKIKVIVQKGQDKFLVSLEINDKLFGSGEIKSDSIVNSVRNNNKAIENSIGVVEKLKMTLSDGTGVFEYRFNEGGGTSLKDYSGNNRNAKIVGEVNWLVEKGLLFDGDSGYLFLPILESSYLFTNGYTLEFESKIDNVEAASRIIDLATGYGLTLNDSRSSINVNINPILRNLSFETHSNSGKSYKLESSGIDIKERHKWKFTVVDNKKGYDLTIYCDGSPIASTKFNYGGISNITRRSNYIGKSNKKEDKLFKGMLYNLTLKINSSVSPVPIYECAMFEYDTSYEDFGKPMEIELETKGMNLNYPMHIKKLKNIFVKGVGGYEYNNFFFELYCDGHLVNDPKNYICYADEATRQIVYEYVSDKILEFNEKMSILGTMRLGKTKLGESSYETKKLIIPAKGKNFTIKLYGSSGDYLSIESIGFVCKLGKVKGD